MPGQLFAHIIILVVAMAHGLKGMTVDSNNTFMDILCSHDIKLNESNSTLVLTAPLYIIPPGNLCLIENKGNLSIITNDSNRSTVIRCSPGEDNFTSTGFTFINVRRLTITNVMFEHCGGVVAEEALNLGQSSLVHFDQGELAVLVCRDCSNLTLTGVKITKYTGRAFIGVDVSGHSILANVNISDNVHSVCYADSAFMPDRTCRGSGMVWLYTNNTMDSSIIDIIDSAFSDNTGFTKVPDTESFMCGDILADSFYSMDISSPTIKPFDMPSAGALSFILQQYSFVQANIMKSTFLNNKGLCYGAILAMYLSEAAYNSLTFSGCEFSNNAQVLSNFTESYHSGLTITLLMKYLGDHNKGPVECFRITDSRFTSQLASCFSRPHLVLAEFPSSSGTCVAKLQNVTGGNIRLLYAVSLETFGSSLHINLSDVRLTGSDVSDQSRLDVGDGLLTFSYISRVIIHGSSDVGSSFSFLSGPVLSAEVSNVVFTGKVHFINASGSSWTNGAALYLRGEAKIWLMEPLNMTFCNNSALEGGAVYSVSRFAQYCAFQFMTESGRVYNSSNIHDIAINVTFISNRARHAGNSIYASPLYNCSNRLSPTIKVDPEAVYNATFNFVDPVKNGLLEMSSRPLQVCSCGDNPNDTNISAINCSTAETVYTYPGKTFNLSVVAIDELNHRVHSVIFNDLQQLEDESNSTANETDFHWNLDDGEDIVQVSGYRCSTLKFTIFSTKSGISGQLTASSSESIAYLSIPIELQNCLPGFELISDRCRCVELLHNKGVQCNVSTGIVTRPGTMWIGIFSQNESWSDYTDTIVGYSNHCPSRYCDNSAKSVNVSNRSSLCVHNRTGVLCGQCEAGLSVTVGGPECFKCSNWWLFTIPLYALFGLAYVVALLVLQLTVAQGTINGLVFYASLLNVNTYSFIAGYTGSRWAVVFISLINLELGFPLCLCHGLDEISKSLLSIVFPTYIWLLAAAFVYISRYSHRFSNLTSHSAIPVLATLIYISYNKLLRFSVNGMTYGTIELHDPTVHDDVPSQNVWYYDGSVVYLHDSKHLVLFLMVLVVVCLFIVPFGVILTGIRFFGRFRMVNKFKPLLDAYFAPYKDKHRYWFGSRLWVIVLVYVLFAILRNLPLVFILCQAIILTLFTLAQVAIMPFRSIVINLLDLFFMVNALLLTIITLYLYHLNSTHIVSAISVGLALIVCCGIIGYHAWKPLKLMFMHCKRVCSGYSRLEETLPKDNIVTKSSLVISGSAKHDRPAVHGHPSKLRDSILADSVADNRDESTY